jgi:hypothetical protein
MLRRFPPILVGLLVGGCFSAAQETETLRAELEPRAAFDLRCDAEELRFTPLDRWNNGVVNAWGVSGCGQRATYLRDYGSGAWVQNTGVGR